MALTIDCEEVSQMAYGLNVYKPDDLKSPLGEFHLYNRGKEPLELLLCTDVTKVVVSVLFETDEVDPNSIDEDVVCVSHFLELDLSPSLNTSIKLSGDSSCLTCTFLTSYIIDR